MQIGLWAKAPYFQSLINKVTDFKAYVKTSNLTYEQFPDLLLNLSGITDFLLGGNWGFDQIRL